MSLEDRLEAFLASDPWVDRDPCPLYGELRQASANYWHERDPAHFVTRYSDVSRSRQNTGPVSQGGYQRWSRARAVEARLEPADRPHAPPRGPGEPSGVERGDLREGRFMTDRLVEKSRWEGAVGHT